jgi:excisionase family DNA binding protein
MPDDDGLRYDGSDFMTIQEVAQYLNLCPATVRKLLHAGRAPIPHVRLGTVTRIPR